MAIKPTPKTFADLITVIEAAADRALSKAAAESIAELLAATDWNVAVSIIDDLARQKSIPRSANIYGIIRDMLAERQYRTAPKTGGIKFAITLTEPSYDDYPRWHELRDELREAIWQRHTGDMAIWRKDDWGERYVLHIAPIPPEGCPSGWYPVTAHYRTGRPEIRREYLCDRKGGEWAGPIEEAVIWGTETHDPIFASIAGNWDEEIRYMERYAEALNAAREKREAA